jgi:hypothetical protein
VLEARDALPCFGPRRLKQTFDLPCSTGAVGRILRQAGRSRRRKKPRPPTRSLAAQKMQWRAFGLLQIDVKDLSDLPGYRELIPFGLPRYQFTARVVPEGGLWLAFSAVNDSTYALLFADRLLAHLKACGVRLRQLVVQTDNGSEFGGNWNRKNGRPAFTKLVEDKYRCRQHRFNPPHRSTYNSDVEAVHGLMEPEFYELEHFAGDVRVFLQQAWAYQLWFNYVRPNSGKGHRSPEQLRAERAPWIQSQVFALPPVLLSSLSAQDLPRPRQILGHDVPGYVNRSIWLPATRPDPPPAPLLPPRLREECARKPFPAANPKPSAHNRFRLDPAKTHFRVFRYARMSPTSCAVNSCQAAFLSTMRDSMPLP